MRHYIIVKFKDEINPREALIPVKTIFEQALDIDGVDNVEVYVSNSDEKATADMMIKMTLTEIALMDFDESKIHKQWMDEFEKYIVSKTIFDCE